MWMGLTRKSSSGDPSFRAVPEQTYGSYLGFPRWTGASPSPVPYIQVKTAIGPFEREMTFLILLAAATPAWGIPSELAYP